MMIECSQKKRKAFRSQALTEFTLILPIFLTMACAVFDFGMMINNSQTLALIAREGANTASRQEFIADGLDLGLKAIVDGSKNYTGVRFLGTDSDGNGLGGAVITVITKKSSNPSQLTLNDEAVPANSVASTGLIYSTGSYPNYGIRNQSKIVPASTNWLAPWRTSSNLSTNDFQNGQIMYVVEVFYTNNFITPIGKMIGVIAPSILYDAAYY
jgi:hypothetical protein